MTDSSRFISRRRAFRSAWSSVITNTSSKNLATTATSENANLAVAAGAAAAGSFVTPQDPRWASVEAGANPLKDMLTKVLTGQASIEDAAKAANAEIEARMNTPL